MKLKIKDGSYKPQTHHLVLAINYSAMPIGKMGGENINVLSYDVHTKDCVHADQKKERARKKKI